MNQLSVKCTSCKDEEMGFEQRDLEKITIDLHMHSDISCDSLVPIDTMCKAAIDKGLTHICFAEHYDMNTHDEGYNFYNHQKYSDAIEKSRDTYAGQLQILKGIEFGEPHLYPSEFERIVSYDFDYVLGSIHWLGDNWVGSKQLQESMTLERLCELHYQETEKACAFGGFDALAHIDFPKRYLASSYEPSEILDRIIGLLVSKNIVMEINTSPLRKNRTDAFPSDTILQKYTQQGGMKVTVGSDAHRAHEIGMNFDCVSSKIAKHGLQVVMFVKRKEVVFQRNG